MRWVAISGSWRDVNAEMEQDVRADVGDIIARGDAMVTGGALGVDYFAADEALKHNPDCSRIKIILPVPLSVFAAHARRRVTEGVASAERVEPNIALLEKIYTVRSASIVEMNQTVCNEETYYARNTEVVLACEELYAYRANNSMGTGDTVDKAIARGIPVKIRNYNVQP